jgi:hypothetical protein
LSKCQCIQPHRLLHHVHVISVINISV